jgi:hypothetical protein
MVKSKTTKIKVIDLFAGIGGIRLGFKHAAEEFGIDVECNYTSEIDKYACQTYSKNYPDDNHKPLSDITKQDETKIPDFDVVLAGFPCQAFSIAGKRGGFEDTRGTLFFDVARIIKEKVEHNKLLSYKLATDYTYYPTPMEELVNVYENTGTVLEPLTIGDYTKIKSLRKIP